jgi:hypothetical protein
MRLSLRLFACIPLCAVLAAACSSSDPADGSATAPDGGVGDDGGLGQGDAVTSDASVDVSCMEYAELACGSTRRCTAGDIERLYGSFDGCLAELKQRCLVLPTLPGTSYTMENLLRCQRAPQATCWDSVPECDFGRGTLATGSGCQSHSQCASAYCKRAIGQGCGVCTEKLADGASCTRYGDCVSGYCSSGQCKALLKEGDVCAGDPYGCDATSVCSGGTCQKATYVATGEVCDDDRILCEKLGSVCLRGRCVDPVVIELGQPCNPLGDGPLPVCRMRSCNLTTNVCEPNGNVGEVCPERGTCAGQSMCHGGKCIAMTADACISSQRDGGAIVDELARGEASDTREPAARRGTRRQ